MTISTTAIKAVAQGNGATTVWPFTFLIPAASELTLSLVDVASGNTTVIDPVNYSVTGLNNPAGGSVTYPLSGSPVPNTSYVVIQRTMPLQQNTSLQNQGAVYPTAIEAALDYLTMITQQLQDQLNRAIIFSAADTVSVTLPTATARANLFLGFDVNGNPIAVSGLTPGTTVSAAMIPVVTAPSTAAALTALGIPGSLINSLIPAGTIWDFAGGTTAPAGFVFAFGQACTSLYPTLRAALVGMGSPFGTNGTDPLMPDLRSRTIAGQSNMGGVDNGLLPGGSTLGAVLGAATKTLAVAELPSHLHSVFLNDPGHLHNMPNYIAWSGQPVTSGSGSGGFGVAGSGTNTNSSSATTGMTVRDTAGGAGTANQTATTGSGTAFSLVQPTLILPKIIKAH